jgi:hypothetical protein
MAAFCTCCGAEIGLKAEACAACGTPRHGMVAPDRAPRLGIRADRPGDDQETDRKAR